MNPPVTPGELLKEEFLDPVKMTPYHLSFDTKLPLEMIEGIINGTQKITGMIDSVLTEYFGLSEGYWLRVQATYEKRFNNKMEDISNDI